MTALWTTDTPWTSVNGSSPLFPPLTTGTTTVTTFLLRCRENSTACRDNVTAGYAEDPGSVDYTDLEPPAYIPVLCTLIYVVVFLVGVAGNVLVAVVVWRTKEMRNSTNYFLVNLSVADLLLILICMPTALADIYSKEVWYLGQVMCELVPLLENTVAHGSALTILAISFERYIAICRPLSAQSVCTASRTVKVIAVEWVVALFSCVAFVFMTTYQEAQHLDGTLVKICVTSITTAWEKAYFITIVAFFFAVPLLILVALYVAISRKLMADQEPVMTGSKSPASSQANVKARKQVVIMLFTVVVFFFVCLLPFRALSLWLIFASQESVLRLGIEGYYNLLYFSRIMFYVNSAINPVLYNIVSTKFRDAFLKVLGCRGRRSRHRHHRKNTFNSSGCGTQSKDWAANNSCTQYSPVNGTVVCTPVQQRNWSTTIPPAPLGPSLVTHLHNGSPSRDRSQSVQYGKQTSWNPRTVSTTTELPNCRKHMFLPSSSSSGGEADGIPLRTMRNGRTSTQPTRTTSDLSLSGRTSPGRTFLQDVPSPSGTREHFAEAPETTPSTDNSNSASRTELLKNEFRL